MEKDIMDYLVQMKTDIINRIVRIENEVDKMNVRIDKIDERFDIVQTSLKKYPKMCLKSTSVWIINCKELRSSKRK